jgi:hypothetical protein
MKKAYTNVVPILATKGMSAEDIANLTELSVKEVQAILQNRD